MSKTTHYFYIVVISILILSNITLFMGKNGRYDVEANKPKAEVVSNVDEGPINLNTATEDELMKVNGIGEKTAEKIITRREELGKFKRIEDLLSVDDIGKNKYEKFKGDFYVD